MKAEVSVLSPRVAYLDHQRLLLNVDNSALKQRIAALAQDKIFKDGTYSHFTFYCHDSSTSFLIKSFFKVFKFSMILITSREKTMHAYMYE
jgi:hypothetical protein